MVAAALWLSVHRPGWPLKIDLHVLELGWLKRMQAISQTMLAKNRHPAQGIILDTCNIARLTANATGWALYGVCLYASLLIILLFISLF